MDINEAKKAKKSKREYKHKDWKGTIRAMITKHPDKFDPEASGKGPKLNPYAIATAMKKKGAKPGYEPQKSTLKGKPKKKKKKGQKTFKEWLELRELSEARHIKRLEPQSCDACRDKGICVRCKEKPAVTNCGKYCAKCWKAVVREDNYEVRNLSRQGTDQIGRSARSSHTLGGEPK